MNVLNGLKLLGIVALSLTAFVGIIQLMTRLPRKVAAAITITFFSVAIFLIGAYCYE